MFGVCLRYGKDRNEAEEIMQEGFIKVFASLQQFRSEGSFEGWIKRIMVTTALGHLRSRPPLHAIVSDDSSAASHVHERETIESNLNAKELLALVQSLPSAYRSVFNLYVFEGYQHKEIADMLGISEGTSKSNLYDARRWLKQRLATASQLSNAK